VFRCRDSRKNIPYYNTVEYGQELNTLDIYFTPRRSVQVKKPIVLYIHGGGWSDGDKSLDDTLTFPQWFVDHGYVFVSVNYRLVQNPRSPHATISDMAKDIARAIKWLTVNGRRYGGHSQDFILLGYSSGAHLAALIATDTTFLSLYNLPRSHIKGVIALDVPHLDIPHTISIMESEETGLPQQMQRLANLYKLFGNTRAAQKIFSPSTYLHPGIDQAAFLIITTGLFSGHRQSLSRRMAEFFINKLRTANVKADHHHFENVDHVEIIQLYSELIAVHVLPFLESVAPSEKGKKSPSTVTEPTSIAVSANELETHGKLVRARRTISNVNVLSVKPSRSS